MALILTRRLNEKIIIGNDIIIEIKGIRGNQVKMSITAPDSVSVDREEIRSRKNLGLGPRIKHK